MFANVSVCWKDIQQCDHNSTRLNRQNKSRWVCSDRCAPKANTTFPYSSVFCSYRKIWVKFEQFLVYDRCNSLSWKIKPYYYSGCPGILVGHFSCLFCSDWWSGSSLRPLVRAVVPLRVDLQSRSESTYVSCSPRWWSWSSSNHRWARSPHKPIPEGSFILFLQLNLKLPPLCEA